MGGRRATCSTFYTERLAKSRTCGRRASGSRCRSSARLIGYRLRPGRRGRDVRSRSRSSRRPTCPPRRRADPGSVPPVDAGRGRRSSRACASRASPARASSRRRSRRSRRSRRGRSGTRSRRRRRRRTRRRSATRDAYLAGRRPEPEAGRRAPARRRRTSCDERWDVRLLDGRRAASPSRAGRRSTWSDGARLDSPARTDPAAVADGVRAPQAAQRVRPQRAAVDGDVAEFRNDYRDGVDASDDEWPDFVDLRRRRRLRGRPRRLAPRRRRGLVGRARRKPTLPRALAGRRRVTELSRAEFAVSGQGDPARARRRRALTQFFATRCARPRSSRSASRSTLAEAPDDSRRRAATRSTSTATSRRCSRAAGCSFAGTTTGGEDARRGGGRRRASRHGRGRLADHARRPTSSTPYERDTVVVHGNVALATHGETVQQLLGSGRARDAVPALHARARPAHVRAVDRRPVRRRRRRSRCASTTCAGTRCRRCTARAPRDRAYARARPTSTARRTSSSATACAASRLPTGVEQRAGDVPQGPRRGRQRRGRRARAAARPAARPQGRRATRRPRPAASIPEPRGRGARRRSRSACARSAARSRCSTTRTSPARSPASSRRSATVLPLRGGRTIVVTVAFEGGDRLGRPRPTWRLRDHGDPHVRGARRSPARRETFRLALKVAVDPAYETDAVLAARRGGAARGVRVRRARASASRCFRSEVVAVAHGVAGVLAVDLDRLYAGATADLADRLRRASSRAVDRRPATAIAGRACSSLDAAPFDWLEVMTVTRAPGLYTTDELYRLLPAVYRIRDAEQGGVLRELLDVLADQVNVLAESLEQLYDDQFIETCADVGRRRTSATSIGYRTLHGVVPEVASPRAEVANTIRYRRRKGTVSVLEQLARDVTGWPARAVEFFELLATTQYMNHVRPHAAGDGRPARRAARLELAGAFQAGAFDTLRAHRRDAPDRDAGRAGTTSRTSASSCGGSRRSGSPARRWSTPTAPGRASASTRSGPTSRCSPRRAPSTDDHAPRRAARRAAAARCAGSRGAPRRDSTAPGCSLLLETETRGGDRRRSRSATSASATSPTTRPRRARGRTSRSRATRTSRSTRCSAGSPSPAAPAAGETRLATFHYGSALAIGGGGYDRAGVARAGRARSVAVEGGDALGPPLDVGRRRRRRSRSSTAAATPRRRRSRRRRPRPARPTATLVAPRRPTATRPLLARGDQLRLAMEPRHDGRARRAAARRRAARDRRGRPTPSRGTLVLRHCTLVPGLTRDPDGEPHSTGRASLIVLHPFAEVTLDHCIVGPDRRGRGRRGDARRLGRSTRPRRTRSPSAAAAAPGGGGLRTVSTAADRADRRRARRPAGTSTLDACTVIGGCTPSSSTSPTRCSSPRSPSRRPVAGAGVGRAPPGRLHPLLVRAARLADAAPLPVRPATTRAHAPVPHLAAVRRPGLHAAPPLDAPTAIRTGAERRERDGRHARALRAAARDATCAPPRRVPPVRPRGRVLLRHMSDREGR